ncbi:MAG: hypothetical protein AAB930_02265, partial [Patescibacteria group bacterium]
MASAGGVWIPAGEFGEIVHELVMKEGGYFNAHAHLDRGFTIDPKYLEHYGITPLQAASSPLKVKQNLTGELHKSEAYQNVDDLKRRIEKQLDVMIEGGVTSVITFIDATPDIGLSAIDVTDSLKEKYQKKLKLQIAAHPIFGFKEDLQYPVSRFDLFDKACKKADIIGALPEKDDRPDSIGSDAHIKNVLYFGNATKKPVHIHTGQDNDPRQRQVFDVIEAVRWLNVSWVAGGEPTVWLVHEISASAYDETKRRKVLEGLKRYNIGVIICPSAALSMRQNRAISSPTHNSIAMVLEMAYVGIPIRIGTDNINDMYVPATPPSMLFEVLTLSNAIRFYDPRVLAKFAA